MSELNQCIASWAQIASALATLAIAFLTYMTIREMKISRTENVLPLLLPELGAKNKSIFNGDLSSMCDLKLYPRNPYLDERKVNIKPFDLTITNIGLGPAFNFTVNEIGEDFGLRSQGSIRIIEKDDFKQVQFTGISVSKDILEGINTMKISYENMYGEKYEQKYDFEVSPAFYEVKSIKFNKPIKK